MDGFNQKMLKTKERTSGALHIQAIPRMNAGRNNLQLGFGLSFVKLFSYSFRLYNSKAVVLGGLNW